MNVVNLLPNPEECSNLIYDFSGHKFDPAFASEIWIKILDHKWFLSEKLSRDVGIKVAVLDFIENTGAIDGRSIDADDTGILKELGAEMVDSSIWDTISDSQPHKQIVKKRIILPLTEVDLARKYGVTPPRTIMFFGAPGTGKPHFVKALAGALGWWYIEVSPGDLMAEGTHKIGANLKALLEKSRTLDQAVLFIGELEEIAGSRNNSSRLDKSITNEFLKQVPLLKEHAKRLLLVCATNHIRDLDAALLRPGRFDCIIPVSGLDDSGRRTLFDHYLSTTNNPDVDADRIISLIPFFTPADMEYLFQQVTQAAFETELAKGEDYQLTTDIFLEVISRLPPSLTPDVIRDFHQGCREFTRY
jgi:SpoVK/Ycf46/Vps4 family AAA+-type ATPase